VLDAGLPPGRSSRGALHVLSWGQRVVQLRLWLYRHRDFARPAARLPRGARSEPHGPGHRRRPSWRNSPGLRDRARTVRSSPGYKEQGSSVLRRNGGTPLSHTEEPPPRIVSDGRQVLLDKRAGRGRALHAGAHLPGVVVLVDKTGEGGRLCDQTLRLRHAGAGRRVPVPSPERQAEPAAGRPRQPSGKRGLLPAGILREPVKHLRRRITSFSPKSNGQRDTGAGGLIAAITRFGRHRMRPPAPVSAALRSAPDAAGAREPRVAEGPPDRRLYGIATPESSRSFCATWSAGHGPRAAISTTIGISEDLEGLFAMDGRGRECLVTTERTGPPPSGRGRPLPVYYLRLEIEIIRGAADFDERWTDLLPDGRRPGKGKAGT